MAVTEETDEEKTKRLDIEQAKLDRENGKLEYFAAITDEGQHLTLATPLASDCQHSSCIMHLPTVHLSSMMPCCQLP